MTALVDSERAEAVVANAHDALNDANRMVFKEASSVEMATMICSLRLALRQMLEVHAATTGTAVAS